jgi:hypothetical protein
VRLYKEVPEWLYRREKLPRQDAIRDALLYGSWRHLQCASAITAAHIRLRIRSARTADSIRALRFSRSTLNNRLIPIHEEERRQKSSSPFLLFT